MADIAAADVTYTLQGHTAEVDANSRYTAVFAVAFGNASLTYPSGGVPLTKASMGCPNQLEELNIIGPASSNGYAYKVDYANAKVRIYQGDNDGTADGPMVEVGSGSHAPAATTLYIKVKGW